MGVLKTPCSAGASVQGGYPPRRTVEPDGTVRTGLVERPRAEWPVLIKDHHEGYVTWADYLANAARLAANRTNAGARPPREGCALCQGIIVCGSCGKPMRTNYHTDQRPAYECSSRADRLTTPTCRSVAAATIDDAVVRVLLDALTPEQVALALSAADEVAGRHQRGRRAAHPGTAKRSPSPAIEMIRRLGPVTPAAVLAAQLNAAGLTTGHGRPFDVKAVQWIRHAYHIPAPAPYAASEISVVEAAGQLGCSTGVIYHWVHTGQLTARRSSGSRLCIPWDAQVRAGCQELITQSARLGRAARPRTLPAPPSPAAEGEVSVTEAAYQLGCSTYAISDWIETGKLAARRAPGNRLTIHWKEQVQAQCRARIEQSGHLNPEARKTKPRPPH